MPELSSSINNAAATWPNPPTVTVILPTYNRARFLPDAFKSIKSQCCTDWELIVVDDGSSDNTRELIKQLSVGIEQPVRYLHQNNQGAYGARNTGLDHAAGRFIAFFDSDDVWLPHHLTNCVVALEANSRVDWVYGACRVLDFHSGKELAANTFYYNSGKPRPFLRLRSRNIGHLRIIDDLKAVRCQILDGLYCGLQNSVIRAELFREYRFSAELRNEAEDQVVVAWALASGYRFGYFDHVHVNYHIHESNSSLAGAQKSLERRLRLHTAIIAGFEKLESSHVLSKQDRRALNRRLSREYFWHLGYATLWQHGRRAEALATYRKGIALWPWNWRYWKTYLLARLRTTRLSTASD